MSNDPTPRGTLEPTALRLAATAAPDGATERPDTSRRTFLQYVGAGIALTSLPAIPGCAVQGEAGPAPRPSAVDVKALVDDATYVDILRKEDLLSFSLGLVNMSVQSTTSSVPPPGLALTGGLWLQVDDVDLPAYLIVNFQPQHIIETAFSDAQNAPAPPGGRVAVDARIGQGSRIVFVVPSNVSAIPYELGPILTALASYGIQVAPNALPAPQPITTVPITYGGGVLTSTGLTVSTVSTSYNPDALLRAIKIGRARRATKAFLAANPGAVVSKEAPQDLVNGLGDVTANPVTNNPVTTNPVTIISNPLPIDLPTVPAQPGPLDTAIELPWRLIISPNAYATFTHDTSDPPPALGDDARIELWHTSLTTAQPWQQTIRALWTRDPDFDPLAAGDGSTDYWGNPGSNPPNPQPFLASLYDDDRGDIVHLTTNYTLLDDVGQQRAAAVEADTLMLSTLGGWLDAHGTWADPPTGGGATNPSMVAWDHVADMGRDNYVRVVDFGYLYPWGHKCVIVRVTERQFNTSVPSASGTAYLWQRTYVIVKEPLRTYDTLPAEYSRNIPFTSVKFKTLITPTLDINANLTGDFTGSQFINVGGKPFPFEVEAFDQEGNKLAFNVSAIFCSYADSGTIYSNPAAINELNNQWTPTAGFMSDMKGQRVAYAVHNQPDDTRYTTTGLGAIATVPAINGAYGVPHEAPFVPQLGVSTLAIDTIRGMTGDATPQPFAYSPTYVNVGFDGDVNVGEVLLTFTNQYDASAKMPGLNVTNSSNVSGGFVAPSMAVSALSRSHGLVSGNPDLFAAGGDVTKNPTLNGLATGFNPSDFFNSLLANAELFGCINIANILESSGVGSSFFDQAPKFLTQALEPIEEILDTANTLISLTKDLTGDIANINAAIAAYPSFPAAPPYPPGLSTSIIQKALALGVPGGPAGWTAQIGTLQNAITGAVSAATSLGTAVTNAISAIGSGGDPGTELTTVLGAFSDAVSGISGLGTLLQPGVSPLNLPLDPGTATQALQAVQSIVASLNSSSLQTTLQLFLNAEDAIENLHIKLNWAPTLTAWPAGSAAIFTPNDPNGLQVSVEIRGKESQGQPAGANITASLSNFQLGLIGANPVIMLDFGGLTFTVSTNADPDIDCVFNGLNFGGALSFVQVLKQFIPLDGFSDPPDVTVDSSGISAAFGLPLPSIAVGMFALENISFNAGFQIPFIGKSLSVDFSFCTRESPFVLTVMMLGGGGFVGITITPAGVQKLEISLEATACLAIDLGIASGSISISVGIYLCIEASDCKLSGFVKFDGNVDILGGLFSASISLDLELSYCSVGNKVIGTAELEIHVAVLCFGVTVSCSVTRKFHGDNTDPTFRDAMAPYACASTPALPEATCINGMEYPWNDYVNAFVPLQ